MPDFGGKKEGDRGRCFCANADVSDVSFRFSMPNMGTAGGVCVCLCRYKRLRLTKDCQYCPE